MSSLGVVGHECASIVTTNGHVHRITCECPVCLFSSKSAFRACFQRLDPRYEWPAAGFAGGHDTADPRGPFPRFSQKPDRGIVYGAAASSVTMMTTFPIFTPDST
jgi:hypothetical protein